METYPRKITLDSPKLTELLTTVNDLVLEGREVSQEIVEQEEIMATANEEMVKIEAAVDITDIDDRAKDFIDRAHKVQEEQLELEKEIHERCKAAVPQELKDKYDNAKKLKEDKEIERNKIGLKIQKFKDKTIPLARKLMKPHLQDEFDDYDGVVLENGELSGTIFNHLRDWKEKWKEKLRQKYMK